MEDVLWVRNHLNSLQNLNLELKWYLVLVLPERKVVTFNFHSNEKEYFMPILAECFHQNRQRFQKLMICSNQVKTESFLKKEHFDPSGQPVNCLLNQKVMNLDQRQN